METTEPSEGSVTEAILTPSCGDDPLCLLNVLTTQAPAFANSTQGTTEEEPVIQYWKLVLVIFPFFMLFGNVLVLMAVAQEPSLKTMTNYLMCSLALADIMVGVIVMPFAIYVEVAGQWNLGTDLCNFYLACDVLASTASILNLAAISVDRYLAVAYPIKYAKQNNSLRIFAKILLVWTISAATASPIMLGANAKPETSGSSSNSIDNVTTTFSDDDTICTFHSADFMIYSSIISFYIPSVVVVLLYWRIYKIVHMHSLKRMNYTFATSSHTTSSSVDGVELKGAQVQNEPLGISVNVALTVGTRMAEVNDSLPAQVQAPEPNPAVPQTPLAVGTKVDSAADIVHVTGNVPAAVPETPRTVGKLEDNAMALVPVAVTAPAAEPKTPLTLGKVVESATDPVQRVMPPIPLIVVTMVDSSTDLVQVRSKPPFHSFDSSSSSSSSYSSTSSSMLILELGAPEIDSRLSFHDTSSSVDLHQLQKNERHGRQEQQANQDGELETENTKLIVTTVVVGADLQETSTKASTSSKDLGEKRLQAHEILPGSNTVITVISSLDRASGGIDSTSCSITSPCTEVNKNPGPSNAQLPRSPMSQKSSLKRESRTTQTVAIVLGAFLLCWIPFFVMNVTLAFCIKHELEWAVCQPPPLLMSFFVWLGYINSLINPVLYTIFSVKYRNAFYRILSSFCQRLPFTSTTRR